MRSKFGFIPHLSSFARLAAILVVVQLVVSCAERRRDDPILARVGGREFARSDLEAAAGVPLDSLPSSTRWRILETWIERTLVDLEGERRSLDTDPALQEKLAALKSDLYRARLLADNAPPLPADTAVLRYYSQHQKEFLRATDAFLIELYWAEDLVALMELRQQLPLEDSAALARMSVLTEGRWLAEAGELDSTLEAELDTLAAGRVTMPRPYGDGYRIVHLIEKFPAGTMLHVDAVRDEIVQRLLIEESRRRQDRLITTLRQRYPVEVMIKDSL